MSFFLRIFAILSLAGLVFSCSETKTEESSSEISYTKAIKLLNKKNYSEAADEFEKIDDEFPFSKWAIKGQTMAIFARYKDEDYTKLLAVADDFLRLNPNSEFVPYVLYMKGLSYYNQIPDIHRAPDNTQQTSYIFRELVARFPNSDYASDAAAKIVFVDEHLAGAKMSVGRYQMKNNNYVGAAQNFSEVIARYRQTNQPPEAYFRLAEIYTKIGVKDEAKKAVQNLNRKFPENYWTKLAAEKNL